MGQEDDAFENLQGFRRLFRLKKKHKIETLKHNSVKEKNDTLKRDVKKQIRDMEEKNELLEREKKTMVAEVRQLKLVFNKMKPSALVSQNPKVRLSLSSES